MTRAMTKVATAPHSNSSTVPASTTARSFIAKRAGSDVAAVDLRRQALDRLAELRQVGVDRERLAIGFERALLVAAGHVDVAEPGPGAEMARLPGQHALDVGDRAHRIVEEEEGRRPAVPGLGPFGAQRQHPVEELDGERKLLRLQRLFGAAHQKIGGVAAGARPAPLDQVRDAVRLALVLGPGKPREKLVEGGGLARLCGLGLGFRIGGLGLPESRSRRVGENQGEQKSMTAHGGTLWARAERSIHNSGDGFRIPPLWPAPEGGAPRSIDLALVGDDLAVVRQASRNDEIDGAL